MEERHGIEVIIPSEAERGMVHDIIYDELCHGIVQAESRVAYQQIIKGMGKQGAQGVILGCTEIALLIRPQDSALPVFDTTELHAMAAVTFAAQ